MSRPTVIGLGELLWDDFPDSRRTGGAPANVAYHANQLGVIGLPASRVGTDADGDELLAALQNRGVSTELVQRDPQHPTGRVSVQLSPRGEPGYIIHTDVAWEHLDPDPALLARCAQADAICFGTLAQRTPRTRETIHACLQAAGDHTLIVYDVNLRQHWYDRDWIERSLNASHIIKLNADELQVLGRMLGTPDDAPEDFPRRLFDRGVQAVVVTRAAEGCSVYSPGESLDIPGEPVEVIDAVGAGDAFAATFILGLLRKWPLARCARLANRIGGLVASRAGAMPDIADEAARLLQSEEQDGP